MAFLETGCSAVDETFGVAGGVVGFFEVEGGGEDIHLGFWSLGVRVGWGVWKLVSFDFGGFYIR